MLSRLQELLLLPAETEWVEFKEAKSNLDFDDIGRYFSALSNEARLNGETAG
jgi:ATP-dependent DNA helicase RecG